MKRLLCTLALLCVAATADARVLIVDLREVNAASGSRDFDIQEALFFGVLNTYGVSYTVVRPGATKTEWVRTGAQVFNGQVTQYDCAIFFNFHTVFSVTGLPVRPDSLTLRATWNLTGSIPILYVGGPNTAAGLNRWAATSTDSTGASGYGAGYNAAGSRDFPSYSLYQIGQANVWKQWVSSAQMYPVPLTRSPATGIWRVFVSAGITSATTDGLTAGAACNPCDDVTRSDNPDSALFWGHYRSAADTGPRFWLNPGCASWASAGLFKMALAALDSITNGKVFEDPRKLNRKRAFFVQHGFSRGNWNDQSSGATQDQGGMFCNASDCDSVNVKTGIDSLASLGIPFTVGVNADSIATYVTETGWWARAPKARFALEEHGGTTTAVGGTATMSTPFDPLGVLRARTLLPGGTTCGSDADSCMFCLLEGAKAILSTYFPGKVDPSVLPAFGDYTPTGFTVAGGTQTLDSLWWTIWKAGFRTVLFGQDQVQSNAGRHFSRSSGPSENNRTAPHGYYGVPRSEPIFSVPGPVSSVGSTSVVPPLQIGTLKIVRMRAEAPATNAVAWGSTIHDVRTEWDFGYYVGQWYQDYGSGAPTSGVDIYYHHDFGAHTSIIGFTASQLGGFGQLSTATMVGYWAVKWMTNEMRACDALMLPNKRLDRWVYASEVDP